ncbi:DUF6262 family protein [Adonisia turfae]|uniref:Transposase n=1 Tax=Adonisia turfae CCMR0081 TaxID=2292702 RepID=A0A6M0RCV6_9CYAN|nr:DUF6262 family protein [Adonisia turfae]NEZ54184.1 hypothetical protein [Adonisia turfae CCMR0081]
MSTKPKTHGLANSAKKKRQATFDKVDNGIQTLIKNKGIISFKSVAETAGVSKAWLYKELAVKQRIQRLQAQQQKTGQSSQPTPPSDHSLRALNNTLRDRIKRLEHDNRELRQQNQVFAGHLLRVRELEKQVQRLEAENQRLKQSLSQPFSHSELEIQLDELGVRLNSTLQNLISTAPQAVVVSAFQALKEAQSKGVVNNPGGFLYAAISDGWHPNDTPDAVIEKTQFNQWWPWAYDQGLVKAATQIDGIQHVLTADDEWLPFDTAYFQYPMDVEPPNSATE